MAKDDRPISMPSESVDPEGPDPLVGTKIVDRYEILARIAKGGTAVVYRSLDTVLNREVAVKIIHEHLEAKGEVVDRFKKEAMMIAQLRHPNIVTVYDFLEYRGRAVLVVEFMPGITLSTLVNSTDKISEDIVLMISLNILNGLKVAHEKGMMHRDIKPANILAHSELGVKISDFGLAKLTEGDDQLTNTGIFVGTPSFSSPEQIEGRPVDHRSDLFSLGLTMYMLATRSHAFKKKGDSTTTVWYKTVRGTFESAREKNPALSEDFERIVNRALEVSIDRRYQSADEMIQDIDGLLRSRGIQLYQRHIKAFLRDPVNFSEFPDRGSIRRTSPWIRMLVIVGLCLLGAGASLFFRVGDREHTPTPLPTPILYESPPTEVPMMTPLQTLVHTPSIESTLEPIPTREPTRREAPNVNTRPTPPLIPVATPKSDRIRGGMPTASIPIPNKVRIVNMAAGELPPLQVSWRGGSALAISDDSDFTRISESLDVDNRMWIFKNLKARELFWRGGSETGEIRNETYAEYRSELRSTKRPLVISSSFGDVDLELNPWLQQIRLVWESGPDASAYRVELSRNKEFTDLLLSITSVVKNAWIERYWDASQVVYWRISYIDEGQNVFLVDPIRRVNLKVKGQPPFFDLVEPSLSSKDRFKLSGSTQFKAIGPADGQWTCGALTGSSRKIAWESLKREGSYYFGRVNIPSDAKWVVCEAKSADSAFVFSIPTLTK